MRQRLMTHSREVLSSPFWESGTQQLPWPRQPHCWSTCVGLADGEKDNREKSQMTPNVNVTTEALGVAVIPSPLLRLHPSCSAFRPRSRKPIYAINLSRLLWENTLKAVEYQSGAWQ